MITTSSLALDGRFEGGGVHGVSDRIDIDEDGIRAGEGNGGNGGHGGVGGGEDDVAGADIPGAQGELKGIGATADAYGAGDSEVGGEFGFEGFDFRAEDVPAAFEALEDGGIDF